MITREGRVKIVDFGLAKVDGEVGAQAQQATLTQTAAGLIVGTVPYMSPEQASGGPADFRSDKFALGVITDEMASATHPFRRDTPVQTLSAIIEHEPPDLAQLNPTLPIPVRWLVQRLLAKDPRDRFASTADIRAELKTIRDHLSELTTSARMPAGRMGVGREWKLAAAGAVLAAGFFALGRTQVPSSGHIRPLQPSGDGRRIPGSARVVTRRQVDRVRRRGEWRASGVHPTGGVADAHAGDLAAHRLS